MHFLWQIAQIKLNRVQSCYISVFNDYLYNRELMPEMAYHPDGVTRTRIRVIGVNLSEFLIKGKEIQFELTRISSYPIRVPAIYKFFHEP